MKRIIKFFDRLEDKVRSKLSRVPILYAIIGGVAIVLFWRGVWYTADLFPFMTGPVSIIISSIIMLTTGLFVSFFIGDRVILSGLKHEKKVAEKTEEEVKAESDKLDIIIVKLHKVEKDIDLLKGSIYKDIK
jgi:type VI protein secretion system component VasK